MRRVGVRGIGSYAPEKVLTNADLENMVDTSDEWIRTRTGIVERRIASEKAPTSALGIRAAKAALEDAGWKPRDVQLVITSTITGDMIFPSTASMIAHGLGIQHVPCFDIAAACSGFIYGLATAAQFILNGEVERALVIAPEELSKITDWTDRNTCVLFGDGAAAACVEPTEKEEGILSTYLSGDGAYGEILKLPAGGSRMPASTETVAQRKHAIYMEGNAVFKVAVRKMTEAAKRVIREAGLTPDDIDLVIPHQANIRILNSVGSYLGIPDKIMSNVARYGNTSAASIGLALAEALRTGRIGKGSTVCLVAFGGGLTWASAVIRL